MKKTTLAMSALALSLGLALSPLSASAAETASSATNAQQMPSLAPMLEKVMPSVVSINVEGSTTVNTPRMPRNFQQFFGDNSPFCQDGSPFQSSPFCQGGGQGGQPDGGQQQKFMALGSGVIIDAAKGYVVTNNHVVDNATTIKVQLSDGRKFDAKVVGKDPRSDIALIQIQEPKNLTAIKLADSDALRVGDYTVAIGNPFGLGETVTSGIVSALGRSGLNVENYENFIQTDAAINRGNSGGALVNLNGELIGIVNAKSSSSDAEGLGFAIPINDAIKVAQDLLENGYVTGRPYMGITYLAVNDAQTAAQLGVNAYGIYVVDVVSGGPADKAGLKAGDRIVSIDNTEVAQKTDLGTLMQEHSAGDALSITIARDGQMQTVSLTLGEKNASNSGNGTNGASRQEKSAESAPQQDPQG